MKNRSIVERGIKDTQLIKKELNKAELKAFNKIKRSLMRTFVNPNHGVRILIDLSAMEYISYIRILGLKDPEVNGSRVARSITEILNELDLTPKSKKATEVTKTLSQIFQTISEEKVPQEE